MDVKKALAGLHPLERKVLPALAARKEVKEICKETGLEEVEAIRAIGWLESKGAAKLDIQTHQMLGLGENGKEYAQKGLPEIRFLKNIQGEEPVDKVAEKAGLNKQETAGCLGVLRQKQAIALKKDKELRVSKTKAGEALTKIELPEQKVLKKLPTHYEELAVDEKEAFERLKQRKKIVEAVQCKLKYAELTDFGKQLQEGLSKAGEILERITPEMLQQGTWKGKTFRRFDTQAPVKPLYAGKLQPYRNFLDKVRKQFMALGFEEMKGPIVENDFWDMDALYMPQFHSARDIHEAYYVKQPKQQPVESKYLNAVAKVHENGGDTGSTGWQYDFDRERTLRCLLRTQATAVSARKLASKDLKIPGKYFSISRCFRHDVIDATHLPDFNQIEGIVVEEGLTLRHLVGLLKTFAQVFAQAEEVKVVPGYFPFTEPSAELFAKHPELGWIELGGAGIFRPEVVKPLLGKNISVLAWGLGIDRLGMFNLGIKDIRNLFSHDLEMLRNARTI